jgi:hypothetical protein
VSTPSADKGATARVYLNDSRGGGYTRLQWETNAGSGGYVSCGCAENATRQFSVTGLGISQQRMRVRVFNGVSWSPWSAYSNSYQPYGQTLDPSNLQADRNGDTITWTWNTPDNGRPTDQVQVRGAVDQTWSSDRQSVSFTGVPGRTYSLEVRAHTAAGWSGWVGPRSASIPEPQASISIDGRGPLHPEDCANCREILWHAVNTKAGSYTVSCYRGGRAGPYYTGQISVYANGGHSGYCSLDPNLSNQVKITISGGPSGTVTSGWQNF